MILTFTLINCKRKSRSFVFWEELVHSLLSALWNWILVMFYWKRTVGEGIVKSKRAVVMEYFPLQQHVLSFFIDFSVWYSAHPLEHLIIGSYAVMIQDAIDFKYSLHVTIAKLLWINFRYGNWDLFLATAEKFFTFLFL